MAITFYSMSVDAMVIHDMIEDPILIVPMKITSNGTLYIKGMFIEETKSYTWGNSKISLTTNGNLHSRFFIETGKLETQINEYLYDESGSIYSYGPYDTFEAYDSGSVPFDKGFGWNGNWKVIKRYDYSVVSVDFMSGYISGSIVSGSDGNDAGWSGSYDGYSP